MHSQRQCRDCCAQPCCALGQIFYLGEARTGGAGGPGARGTASSFSNSGQDKYTSVLLPGLHTHTQMTHTHTNDTYATHKKGKSCIYGQIVQTKEPVLLAGQAVTLRCKKGLSACFFSSTNREKKVRYQWGRDRPT